MLLPDELDLASVVRRWSTAVKTPDRLHVLTVDATDPLPAWQALGRVVGFDADALPLPAGAGARDRVDAATLRMLADTAGAAVSSAELADLAESWAKLVADEGYDVHGDLTVARAQGSDDTEDAERVAILSDALSESVAELVRARDEVSDLHARLAKAQKKRRKLKKKLAAS